MLSSLCNLYRYNAPALERFAANLPAFRDFNVRANPALPRLAAWFDAMVGLYKLNPYCS